MQDAVAERNEVLDQLEREVELMRSSGCQMAENEAEYRKAVRVETLRLLADGERVTVVSDLVRGIGYVSDLKFALRCSEAVYKSSQEKINVLKLRLRSIEADIERMWHSR